MSDNTIHLQKNKFQISITAQSIIFGVNESISALNFDGFKYNYEIKKIKLNEFIGKRNILNMDKELQFRYKDAEVIPGSKEFIVLNCFHLKDAKESNYNPREITTYCKTVTNEIDLEIQKVMKILKLYDYRFIGIKDTFFRINIIPHFDNNIVSKVHNIFKDLNKQLNLNLYDFVTSEAFNLIHDYKEKENISIDAKNLTYTVNLPYSFNIASDFRLTLSKDEVNEMKVFLYKYYNKFKEYKLENALSTFDSSFTYDRDNNLLKLVTTLEILFKINKAGNVKRQLSKKISYMTYDNDKERIECNLHLNKCYEARNEYIHEGSMSNLTFDDMLILRKHVKNTLLKFVDFIDNNKDNSEIFADNNFPVGSFQYYKINVNTYFYKIIRELDQDFWGIT